MADLKISALTASTTPLAGTEVLPIVQSSTTKQVSVANLTAGRAVVAGTLVVGPTAKQANNSFEVNANTSYAGFIQNTGFGVGGTPINPSTSNGLHIGYNRSNGNGESNLVWGSGAGALSDLVIAQWNGTTYSVHTTLKKGGELNVANGNIEIGTSGKGIDFSATAGTGTSELLADYEEGTWTPVLTGFSGSSGITFSTQKGGYVKVGKQVTVNCSLTLSAKTSITGIVVINGLPFTAGTAGGSVGFALGYWQNFATTFASITGYIDASTTRVILGGQATAGSSFAFMADANIASNTTINFAATYLVD